MKNIIIIIIVIIIAACAVTLLVIRGPVGSCNLNSHIKSKDNCTCQSVKSSLFLSSSFFIIFLFFIYYYFFVIRVLYFLRENKGRSPMYCQLYVVAVLLLYQTFFFIYFHYGIANRFNVWC